MDSQVASNTRILVVDDNADNLMLLKQVLEASGYEPVKTLADPNLAVQTVLDWDPDLVLLDLHMPDLSGYDILDELKLVLPEGSFIPVLICTADWTASARRRALDMGAFDFITKPFDMEELLLRVRNFLRMRNMHLELQSHNERLNQLAAELQIANGELQGFTYSVSHDLRGPLRAIMSTSHMLIEDCAGRLEPEHVAMLERQVQNAGKLATIIDELLKLSRIARADMVVKEIDLTLIARDVASEIEPDQKPEQSRFVIEEGMKGRGDALLTRLVLVNLMGNAAKFSPNGSSIQVSQSHQDGEFITCVRDEGIGFDIAFVDRIFKPFERLVTDKEFAGTGIGLANVKRIIDRHGGRVWAESELGKGSAFFFTLCPH